MNNKNSLSQANVDLAEIDKFSSVATRWWDQTSEFQPLHRINPLRLNYILQHANGLFGKKCSILAAAVEFYQKVWRKKVP